NQSKSHVDAPTMTAHGHDWPLVGVMLQGCDGGAAPRPLNSSRGQLSWLLVAFTSSLHVHCVGIRPMSMITEQQSADEGDSALWCRHCHTATLAEERPGSRAEPP